MASQTNATSDKRLTIRRILLATSWLAACFAILRFGHDLPLVAIPTIVLLGGLGAGAICGDVVYGAVAAGTLCVLLRFILP
ncbi:MAG: hypothetical protein U0836_03645 [Pirellulales bacterium]